LLHELTTMITGGPLQSGSLYLLSQVRGFPPIAQTVHILAIAAIMGSIVLIDLRMLGVALPSQSVPELTRRLLPWTWWALPALALSGLPFVFARPQRYEVNPIFRLKFVLMAAAVAVTLAFHIVSARDASYWERTGGRAVGRLVGAASLLLWVGVILAGRWIAYADYLLPPEE
jgi:hypothetical protein